MRVEQREKKKRDEKKEEMQITKMKKVTKDLKRRKTAGRGAL